MKLKSLKLAILFLTTLTISSCRMNFVNNGIDGKGPVVEKEFQLNEPFGAVKTTSGWNVELIKSDAERIVVRTEENLTSIFQYEIEDGELRIFNKENIGKSKSRTVKIYYKSLSKIRASSGSELRSSEVFEQKDLTLSASSGAELKLHVKTENCTASTSSGGEMELYGTSVNFLGHSSSGSELDAKKLKTKKSDVKASSGASIKVNAIESLTANTSSGGDIDYSGHPKKTKLKQSISGGDIEQDD